MHNLLYLTLIFTAFVSGGKYSADLNTQSTNIKDGSEFRMKKINLVWHKAQKRLSSSQLEGIHADLLIQDKLELDLKQRKSDGFDDDGEYEAVVRRKFMGILKKYGLAAVMDDRLANALPNAHKKVNPNKLDGKLDKIWKKAQMGGFSENELSKLLDELGHQQEKMDEYNTLKNDISQFAGNENSIHRFDDKDEAMLYKQKKTDLKNKYNDIKESYQYLETYLSRDPKEEIHFNQPRVIELWLLAKKANFTEVELNSFKEELHHFERKLEKKEYLQKELDIQTAKKQVIENNDALNERHSHMERKVHDYQRKIKKTHTELKSRVAHALNTRNEL